MRRRLAGFLITLAVILFLIGKFHANLPVIGKGGALLGISGGVPHGTLNCNQLEALWVKAGGSRSTARMAAAIAMAESSGRQNPPSNASSNYNGKSDIGYWQINSGIHPGLATSDPIGNARAAIRISHDGTDWSQWVTYQNGAQIGLC